MRMKMTIYWRVIQCVCAFLYYLQCNSNDWWRLQNLGSCSFISWRMDWTSCLVFHSFIKLSHKKKFYPIENTHLLNSCFWCKMQGHFAVQCQEDPLFTSASLDNISWRGRNNPYKHTSIRIKYAILDKIGKITSKKGVDHEVSTLSTFLFCNVAQPIDCRSNESIL